MPRPLSAIAAVTLAALALALAGCASDPTRLAPGSTRAQALQQLGTPTAVYSLGSQGERLQYSRAPSGYEVNNVDLDASGHVREVRQELDERLFDRTIEPGAWTEADVLRSYGRPFEITEVSSFDGKVWTWRYKAMNARRLLYIYVDRSGRVARYHTGDDLQLERLPL